MPGDYFNGLDDWEFDLRFWKSTRPSDVRSYAADLWLQAGNRFWWRGQNFLKQAELDPEIRLAVSKILDEILKERWMLMIQQNEST